MKDSTRRAVAFLAVSLISDSNRSAIYDYNSGKYFSFGQINSHQNPSTYDYTEKCFVAGNSNGSNSYSIFHYGNRKFLNLNIKGLQFDGFDYDSNKFFSGSVNGNAISIFDYEHSHYYNYSI